MVSRKLILAAAVVGLSAVWGRAEDVQVPGSDVRYPSVVLRRIGDQDMNLNLTGVAVRKKAIFSIYAIGSYLQQGVTVKSPEELAHIDAAKQLHLVMERSVDGDTMAKAFMAAIQANYPGGEFQGEMEGFAGFLKEYDVKKGDSIILTHVPGVGFRCSVGEQVECHVESVPFSRAIWEIYLGKNNLGETIKRGLVSRLGR